MALSSPPQKIPKTLIPEQIERIRTMFTPSMQKIIQDHTTQQTTRGVFRSFVGFLLRAMYKCRLFSVYICMTCLLLLLPHMATASVSTDDSYVDSVHASMKGPAKNKVDTKYQENHQDYQSTPSAPPSKHKTKHSLRKLVIILAATTAVVVILLSTLDK
jgi:hypothetical protein